MLAKGHHFPNITLVAILDADSGLFSADFRGQEHMGQTIVQVAGRAGRADRAGEVLIQSRHGSHETLQTLANDAYSKFSEQQLQGEKQRAVAAVLSSVPAASRGEPDAARAPISRAIGENVCGLLATQFPAYRAVGAASRPYGKEGWQVSRTVAAESGETR